MSAKDQGHPPLTPRHCFLYRKRVSGITDVLWDSARRTQCSLTIRLGIPGQSLSLLEGLEHTATDPMTE